MNKHYFGGGGGFVTDGWEGCTDDELIPWYYGA